MIRYDILVLATGSAASVPSYVTQEQMNTTKGMFVYRSIADLEAIMKYAQQDGVDSAEIIGGGVSLSVC
jgi:nitrite reductase (NAD(P)H)